MLLSLAQSPTFWSWRTHSAFAKWHNEAHKLPHRFNQCQGHPVLILLTFALFIHWGYFQTKHLAATAHCGGGGDDDDFQTALLCIFTASHSLKKTSNSLKNIEPVVKGDWRAWRKLLESHVQYHFEACRQNAHDFQPCLTTRHSYKSISHVLWLTEKKCIMCSTSGQCTKF